MKKPLILGAVVLCFHSSVGEILHGVVVLQFTDYAEHPVWFGLYGAIAAGLFEEGGRFILFVCLLKNIGIINQAYRWDWMGRNRNSAYHPSGHRTQYYSCVHVKCRNL